MTLDIIMLTLYNIITFAYFVLACTLSSKHTIMLSMIRYVFKIAIGSILFASYYNNIIKFIVGFVVFYIYVDIITLLFQEKCTHTQELKKETPHNEKDHSIAERERCNGWS